MPENCAQACVYGCNLRENIPKITPYEDSTEITAYWATPRSCNDLFDRNRSTKGY